MVTNPLALTRQSLKEDVRWMKERLSHNEALRQWWEKEQSGKRQNMLVLLWRRIAYIFVGVLVPVYWRFWEPRNFLWFPDVAPLTTTAALCAGSTSSSWPGWRTPVATARSRCCHPCSPTSTRSGVVCSGSRTPRRND